MSANEEVMHLLDVVSGLEQQIDLDSTTIVQQQKRIKRLEEKVVSLRTENHKLFEVIHSARVELEEIAFGDED